MSSVHEERKAQNPFKGVLHADDFYKLTLRST